MPRREANRIGGRALRYAKVSAAAVKVGAGVVSRKAKKAMSGEQETETLLSQQRQQNAEALRIAMGGLKGPLMKIAQILGTIPDLVPKEYAVAFAELQADAPSMGWSFVRRRMATELGVAWQKKFLSFEKEAAAAASLGQVHRAMAFSGEKLACKLQYPDMESVVEADLQQLKFLLSFYEKMDRAVSTGEVQKEIAERLYEELDYVREAKHIRLFQAMLKGQKGVRVPKVFSDLSTPRLLTMEWLEGQRLIEAAKTRSQAERDQIAVHMFQAWYAPFYGYGVLHGDPHLGNYSVQADGTLNLLDFGCVRVFEPALVDSVVRLYQALRDKDEAATVDVYRVWGFKNPSKKLVEILNIWARFIYAPILEDKTRPIEETNTGLYGREVARKIHQELRAIGGITIPRAFVFMDRAAIGLGSVFLRLKANVNWFALFHDLIEGFDLQEVLLRQKKLFSLEKWD